MNGLLKKKKKIQSEKQITYKLNAVTAMFLLKLLSCGLTSAGSQVKGADPSPYQ